MAPWLALINTAPEDVDDLSNSLTNCAGTTDEMAEAMMSGFGGSVEKLKSSIDVLMTSLGELAATYLTPLIEKVQSAVDWFNGLDDS
jgi:TP901 family phage tail tape measure protein